MTVPKLRAAPTPGKYITCIRMTLHSRRETWRPSLNEYQIVLEFERSIGEMDSGIAIDGHYAGTRWRLRSHSVAMHALHAAFRDLYTIARQE